MSSLKNSFQIMMLNCQPEEQKSASYCVWSKTSVLMKVLSGHRQTHSFMTFSFVLQWQNGAFRTEPVWGPQTLRSFLSDPLQKAHLPCPTCARQRSDEPMHLYSFCHGHCPLKQLCLPPCFYSERDEEHLLDWCSVTEEDRCH